MNKSCYVFVQGCKGSVVLPRKRVETHDFEEFILISTAKVAISTSSANNREQSRVWMITSDWINRRTFKVNQSNACFGMCLVAGRDSFASKTE